jgi:hypothetical protein
MPPLYQSSDYRRSLLGILLSLKGQRKGIDVTTAVVACIFSLTILCWTEPQKKKCSKSSSNPEDDDSILAHQQRLRKKMYAVFERLPLILQNLLRLAQQQRQPPETKEPSDKLESDPLVADNDTAIVDHIGSCQCESVIFRVRTYIRSKSICV